MLVFTNYRPQPNNFDVFYDCGVNKPWTFESGGKVFHYTTVEALLQDLYFRGFLSGGLAETIREKAQKLVRCPYSPGKTCRGCKYSSDPDLFDGCCLYGHT